MSALQQLLRDRAEDARPGLRTRDGEWSWAEHVAAAAARAGAVRALLDTGRPPHVGVLLDNTVEMVTALSAAALGGHVVVGLNTTRRGEALAADVRTADCQVVLTDAANAGLLEGLRLDVPVLRVDSAEWTGLLSVRHDVPDVDVADADLFMLIFTSGTSGDPKAVRVTHEKVSLPGQMLAGMFGLDAEDVCYVSMPLFHSNAVMAGYAPAVATGATIALAERFSASGFLADVRRFGATYMNYVGKPLSYILSTPARPDDADNPLRIAFGNEANEKDAAAFGERFGCRVQDGFGSTENAVVISRVPGTPPGALGVPLEGVKILDPATGVECPVAELGSAGELLNADAAVGELVNTRGAGQFAGYYNDEAATAERMRGGMYWSGDLAYRDASGFVYFAGRTADWLRVDGENLAAAPVERILLRHESVEQAAVYAVPDEAAGDQVMAALVCRGPLSPDAFAAFLDEQPDLSPKARPRFVRVLDELPRTATNKVLKRELAAEGAVAGRGVLWAREPRGTSYSTVDAPAPP